MIYTIKFEENSLDDFLDGLKYYENISEELANRFDFEFWKTVDFLKENPLLYQCRYRNIRIAFTKNFPFGIHFTVDENLIIVYKILHTKRLFK
jgi:hypothetical protein